MHKLQELKFSHTFEYDAIRSFVEVQSKTEVFPENIDDVKNNLEISGLFLKDNEECYSSKGIATEQKISQALIELENLTMNGLYVLDDDVLGMLLQIKIYIMNLNTFPALLRGYYESKENASKKTLRDSGQEENNEDEKEVKIATSEDINQISELYFHHLSILLNNEYQNMIERLQEMVIRKASKPKFERKEKRFLLLTNVMISMKFELLKKGFLRALAKCLTKTRVFSRNILWRNV